MPREHILLFENQKGLQRIMTLLLRQAEMKVTSSDQADMAIDIIRSAADELHNINVVIIDVSYPYPEGEKLLRKLHEDGNQLPTIIITQYGNENRVAGIGNDGNYSLLSAPFEPEELLQSIREASLQT